MIGYIAICYLAWIHFVCDKTLLMILLILFGMMLFGFMELIDDPS